MSYRPSLTLSACAAVQKDLGCTDTGLPTPYLFRALSVIPLYKVGDPLRVVIGALCYPVALPTSLIDCGDSFGDIVLRYMRTWKNRPIVE